MRDIDVIREELHDPIAAEPSTQERNGAASRAEDLASAAYGHRKQEAIDEVERLLYTVHASHAFAPPLQGIASTVWPILMRAKLRANLACVEVAPELDDAQMVAALRAAVTAADVRDHGFIDDIAAADDLDGLVLYTRNWFGSSHGWSTQLFSLTQRCNGNARLAAAFKACLENVYEEFEKVDHPEMRARWPKRIGLEYSVSNSLAEPDQLTESFALQNFRTGLCAMNDPTYGLGSFYSIEAAFPGVCRRMYPTLVKRGFDEADIATFRIHDMNEDDHAEEMLEALVRCELRPRDRANIVRGALAQMELRHQMFDAMRERMRTKAL